MGWHGILGFEYGIVQAPLGPDISGPELVAAVANAGGLAFLRAPDWVCFLLSLHLLFASSFIVYPFIYVIGYILCTELVNKFAPSIVPSPCFSVNLEFYVGPI